MIPNKIWVSENCVENKDYKLITEINKQKIYKILEDIISVLKEYNIECFAYGGTLLGAIRHADIVPWDDDIDLLVPMTIDQFWKYKDPIVQKLKTLDPKYDIKKVYDKIKQEYRSSWAIVETGNTEFTVDFWFEYNSRYPMVQYNAVYRYVKPQFSPAIKKNIGPIKINVIGNYKEWLDALYPGWQSLGVLRTDRYHTRWEGRKYEAKVCEFAPSEL